MEQSKRKELQLTAAKARLLGVQMVHDAASGHPGGSMSCMDVLTYLYFAEMHVDPKNPHDPERDRFVMSKGHCSPAVYPTLALRGFFPVEDLKMFRRIDGHMSGHVEMKYVPGVDMSTGSLGQGISVAVGMALAGKVAQKDYRVYAILGDGEVAEGISARVIDMHTIKPLDTELVLKAAKETGAIVTTEEANVLGGLGAAVAEYLSENYPVPVVRHGVNDEFGRSGKAPLVLDAYGVNADGIIAKVKQALAMKK